ncbi:Glycine cleavage system H protein [Clostridium bornimense]|uniref:Glycine cleavage system H protein n=1 Tax=Clostridium bornimense TaxID=1216932 RepID=W6S220_9CLOT|nr:glycine cleavage system protein GcvH [Clostridium bornimense]CDM69919.1 Glycine cleavage system H protein [Clostridium bornimense]
MKLLDDIKYTKSHEWVKFIDDATALIGLSDYAQSELGDLVFINLPEEGDSVEVETAFCDVESVKAVSDVYSPVSGEVIEINEELLDNPAMVNENPYDAWFIKVGNITDKSELLSKDDYVKFVESEQE